MSEIMPKMAGVFAFVAIASLGLPGLAGFWGEVMALLSSFNPSQALGLSVGLFRGFMIAGGVGTVLTAGYFLWMLQRVNMGALPDTWKDAGFKDVLTVEWLSWVPLLLLVVVLGLAPRLIFGVTDGPVNLLVDNLAHVFGG
jgi:NADH-quinone oxidoreductase subunit M